MKEKSITKRDRIQKANSTVFIAVAVAAIIVAVSLVGMKFLWSKFQYNNRVINAKIKASSQLKRNSDNIDQLSKEFPALETSSVNSKKALNALPPSYDYAALVTSIQKIADQSGVALDGGVAKDDSAAALKQSDDPSPVEIPLNIGVEGSYESVDKFMQMLEHSIRPIIVTSVTYTGSNSNLKATLTAKTYYQPARSLDISKRTIQ